MNNMFYLSCVFLIFQVTGCKNYETLSRESYKVVEESEVIQVFLDGEVSSRNSEISGLSWYNDYLVLLPQYPDNYGSKFEGAFFKISKSKIDTFLQSQNKAPLKPVKVDVNFNGLDPDLLSIGSGFEAITFLGDDVYLTIECGEFFDTYAYICKSAPGNFIKFCIKSMDIWFGINICSIRLIYGNYFLTIPQNCLV